MTIYDLKPAFQNLLRPLVKMLNRMGTTPNQITIFTFFISVLYSYFLYLAPESLLMLLLPLFFFSRMALNAMDGILAKEFNMITPLGTILNEVTDVLSDTVLFLALSSHPLVEQNLIFLIVGLSGLTEFIGITAVQIGAQRRYDGPMGKSDRVFVLGIMAVFLFFNAGQKIYYTGMFYIMILLLVATCMNRMMKAISRAEKR